MRIKAIKINKGAHYRSHSIPIYAYKFDFISMVNSEGMRKSSPAQLLMLHNPSPRVGKSVILGILNFAKPQSIDKQSLPLNVSIPLCPWISTNEFIHYLLILFIYFDLLSFLWIPRASKKCICICTCTHTHTHMQGIIAVHPFIHPIIKYTCPTDLYLMARNAKEYAYCKRIFIYLIKPLISPSFK